MDEVFQNIKERSEEIKSGKISDKKTALIIPGGTLSSVCSCASFTALNKLGINYFDSVYAVSSGAINAMYGLANQAAEGVTVYLEDASTLRFINPFRIWNMMDLKFLFREIIQGKKPINLKAFGANSSKLKVLTTNVRSHKKQWLTSEDGNILDILKASCSIQVLASSAVSIGGEQYCDGYMFEPIPLATALDEHYSDILVLLNRPIERKDTPPPLAFLIRYWIRRKYGEWLVPHFTNNRYLYNHILDLIRLGKHTGRDGHVSKIAYIAPNLECAVGPLNMRGSDLFFAGYSCWEKTLRAFHYKGQINQDEFLKTLEKAGLKRNVL